MRGMEKPLKARKSRLPEEELIRQAMSILGKRTSPKKAESSRRNGRLGGRPRKIQLEVNAGAADKIQ